MEVAEKVLNGISYALNVCKKVDFPNPISPIHTRSPIYTVSLNIPLRRLKVAILSFSDIFLISNGPVADSGIQLPMPLILMYIMTQKWTILLKNDGPFS